MAGGLEGALGPGEADRGLRFFLELPLLRRVKPIRGLLGVEAFCEKAIVILNTTASNYQRVGKKHAADRYEAGAGTVQRILNAERERLRIPWTPFEIEQPRAPYDPLTGRDSVVVGGGPGEGGYSVELASGENIVHWR